MVAAAVASLLVTACRYQASEGVLPPDDRCSTTPRLLVSASSYPVTTGAVTVYVSAIAVVGLDVYYVVTEEGPVSGGPALIVPSKAGAVMRVPVAGGQPVLVADGYSFHAPIFTATSLILGEAAVEADGSLEGAAIVSIPLSGGSPTTLVQPATRDSLQPFDPPPVTDGTFVYYVSENGVEAAAVSPDPAGSIPTLLISESPFRLGIFGQRLLLFTQGSVESVPLGSSIAPTKTTLATGLPDGSVDVTGCGANACWLNLPYGTLLEIDPMGGPANTLAQLTPQLEGVSEIAFDGRTFFVAGAMWPPSAPEVTVQLSGVIGRVPREGGPAVAVVTAPASHIDTLAVDDECIYFAAPPGIFSVAKTVEGTVVP
jgi:hypothetical protein